MDNIIYKNNRIILFAQYDDPKMHKHFSKHILISNKPFLCKTSFGSILANSIIIKSNILHYIERSKNSKVVVFLIDETTSLSQAIDVMYLKDKNIETLPQNVENKIINLLDGGYSLVVLDKYVMEQVIDEETNYISIESRVLEAIRLIEQSESIDNDIYDYVSKKTFLSKSRFLHLFKEEIGIDFKNYLLLKKLEKTYYYVTQNNMNITDAAILAGFSSSSHFSSACKKHYGISLTDFLKAQNKISV